MAEIYRSKRQTTIDGFSKATWTKLILKKLKKIKFFNDNAVINSVIVDLWKQRKIRLFI